MTTAGGTSITYDARQNIATSPTGTYGYDALSRMTSANPGTAATFGYDPAGRLYQSAGASTTRFLYDGVQAIGEYNTAGTLLRRHVPGVGMDETVASYDGAGTTNREWLLADERGSIIALANASGAATTINTYDEYGVPGSGNAGRFQYTGQMWLAEAQLYHYKARAYDPRLGRFMQTDPIGYGDGANLYAYVGADPVNWTDPFGFDAWLVSRPAVPGGFHHMFVVIADCLGCGGTIYSFGPSGSWHSPGSLISSEQTTRTDTIIWRMISMLDYVSYIRIDAPDNIVSTVGDLLKDILGDDSDPGEFCYAAIPGVTFFCVNSNSAAYALAETSRRVSGGGGSAQALPPGYAYPGYVEYRRIRIPVIVVEDPVEVEDN